MAESGVRPLVTFDLKEPSVDLDRASYILEHTYGFTVNFDYLKAGDMVWTYSDDDPDLRHGVVVERKTPQDLRSSRTGRLQGEVRKMSETGLDMVLLLDGIPRRSETYGFWTAYGDPHESVIAQAGWGVTYSEMSKFLLSVQRTGVLLSPWPPGYLAEAVASLYRYFERLDHRSMTVKPKLAIGDLSDQETVISAIAGMGTKKARLLMERYESIEQLIEAARMGELRKQKIGIGRELESRIVKIFSSNRTMFRKARGEADD